MGAALLGVGLSGLFVLADWVGSAETWFPYTAPIAADDTFDAYWREARNAASMWKPVSTWCSPADGARKGPKDSTGQCSGDFA
jgi:hypothetical protein